MHSAKQKKIAIVSFAALVVVMIFANALITTKDVRHNPTQIQRNMLQTSQKTFSVKAEEKQESNRRKDINVGMALIVAGSVIIVIAGSASAIRYKRQEAFK